MTTQLLAFTGLAALLVLTPGVDMALVAKIAFNGNRRAVLGAVLGINLGTMFWGAAAGLGVAALLNTSTIAFTVLKLAGAAYLFYLGLSTLWQMWRTGGPHAAGTASGGPKLSGRGAFRQGLLTDMLNPKMGVFYTSLLPQFVAAGDPVLLKSLLLAGIHVVLTFIWLMTYAYLINRFDMFLSRPPVKRVLDGLTGMVLIGFGLRLVLEER